MIDLIKVGRRELEVRSQSKLEPSVFRLLTSVSRLPTPDF